MGSSKLLFTYPIVILSTHHELQVRQYAHRTLLDTNPQKLRSKMYVYKKSLNHHNRHNSLSSCRYKLYFQVNHCSYSAPLNFCCFI